MFLPVALVNLAACQSKPSPLEKMRADAQASVPAGYRIADQPLLPEVDRLVPNDVPGWNVLVKDNCYYWRYGDVIYPATPEPVTDQDRLTAQPFCAG